MERSSGILLHITSLPSKYGIGNLGKEAYAFVDFLKQAGQKYWQILPLCPPGYGDSPYQGFSTFAGNPYLIDPEELVEKGWLARKTLESVQWSQRDDQVDFRQMYDERLHMLQAAFSGFHENEPADFQAFVEQEAAWLPEYALFMAIKAHFNDRGWSGRRISACISRRQLRSTARACRLMSGSTASCNMCSISSGRT